MFRHLPIGTKSRVCFAHQVDVSGKSVELAALSRSDTSFTDHFKIEATAFSAQTRKSKNMITGKLLDTCGSANSLCSHSDKATRLSFKLSYS